MKTVGVTLLVASLLCGGLAAQTAAPGPAAVNPSEAVARAEQLLERRDYVGAEAALREAITRDPKLARAYADLTLALLGQRRVRDAVAVGRRAVELDPRSPDARFRFGMALSEDHHPVEAAREFERVVAAIPGKPVPLRALASAYAAADDSRAVGAFEGVLRLTPADAGAHAQFADYLWSHAQDRRGNTEMEEALCLAPRDPALHARYGRALYHEDRYLDAASELQQSIDLGGRSYVVLYLLGNAQRESGRMEEAVAAFESAILLDPEKDLAHHDLGKLLVAAGRPELAIPHLEVGVAAHPASAQDLFDLGSAYEAAGRTPEALSAYRKAAEIAPALPGPHYGLGRLLARQGHREEADRELALYRTLYEKRTREFTENDSTYAEIRLGWLEMNQGNPAGALARFRSLPEMPDTLLGTANALSRLGRHREAVTVLERARRLAPDNREIQSLLAQETRQQ